MRGCSRSPVSRSCCLGTAQGPTTQLFCSDTPAGPGPGWEARTHHAEEFAVTVKMGTSSQGLTIPMENQHESIPPILSKSQSPVSSSGCFPSAACSACTSTQHFFKPSKAISDHLGRTYWFWPHGLAPSWYRGEGRNPSKADTAVRKPQRG